MIVCREVIEISAGNHLSALRSMLRRLRQDNPKYEMILEDYRLREAGVRGEERLAKKLRELRMQFPYIVLRDVNLADGDWMVQIDCLLITDRVCLVLEAKNISGKLHFDETTDEFYRINENGQMNFFPNPHYQVLKHIRFMEHWFEKHNIPLPVSGAAFMTAKNSSIINKPPSYRVYKLETAIERIVEQIRAFPTPILSSTDLTHIKETILYIQSHYSLPPLCDVYGIPHYEIERGVICPSCGQLPMEWQQVWICPFCKSRSKNAHIPAIEDYMNIIKSTITNKEFREFCHVPSVFTASRLLKNSLLNTHEVKKKRYYTLKESE